MEQSLIRLEKLRKEYLNVVAVRDVELDVNAGEILGLIGPNGAGKTTLLRMLATTLEPTSGRATLAGRDIWDDPTATRRRVGCMPDFFHLYEAMKVGEFLTYFGMAHRLVGRQLNRRVKEVLNVIDLADKAEGFVRGLSRGMMQRLALGRAIIHRPQVLLLDEPASGLDPLARRDLFVTLRRCHEEGSTILISSHILGELSELCTSVGIMDRGVFLEAGPTDEIVRKVQPRRQITLVVTGNMATAMNLLAQHQGVTDLAGADGRVSFRFDGANEELAEINAALVAAGVGLALAEEVRTSLQEVYFAIAERQGRTHA